MAIVFAPREGGQEGRDCRFFSVDPQGQFKFSPCTTPQCSLLHYLQQPRHGSNLNVHQQRNG